MPFLQFTLNARYIARWICGGVIFCVPGLNFLSLGFLSRTSRLVIIGGGIGLPTWQEKYETWIWRKYIKYCKKREKTRKQKKPKNLIV